MADTSLTEYVEVTNHATVLRDMLQQQYQGHITEAVIKQSTVGCYKVFVQM